MNSLFIKIQPETQCRICEAQSTVKLVGFQPFFHTEQLYFVAAGLAGKG
jgi:hypothetical protein